MFVDLLWLVFGLVIIIKGGDMFVGAAIRMAEFLRMPRVVIGGTLVSLATTSPELVVSLMSGAKGEPGLAVGNAVGSCVCNIGLILGVTAYLKPVLVHPAALRASLLAMGAFGLILFLMTADLSLSRIQGAALVGMGIVYFAWDFWRNARDRKPADTKEAAAITENLTGRERWLQTKAGVFVVFLAGAALVVLGSRFLVDSAVSIAAALGVPSMVVGLTVVAVGTSLPELVTAVTSSRKSAGDLAVGNILGANIANLTFVIGAAAGMKEVPMDRATQVFNFPALLVSVGMLVWVLLKGGSISRREGAILIAFYIVYLAVVVAMSLARKG